ncbi:uncharacterized protein LOC112271558 isoform X2 [Brachypodium distachyon]|uniref:Uncharacterized protein n=1 Tax=Brachypodium distachyon TaxID=15368 RepID=A0A2K2CX75_BRADI|nr:uncharacterized protein LOC112271558 isoform X2 [Brachypodium distachyon]PNT66642.1 hypothetical protein BRADI_3g15110v3 [Brachypodium distachyon]|eukprot:XP_024316660.1 uncharacterized protein LOC112271558 isoform X2 [Brachypodium distachyon]
MQGGKRREDHGSRSSGRSNEQQQITHRNTLTLATSRPGQPPFMQDHIPSIGSIPENTTTGASGPSLGGVGHPCNSPQDHPANIGSTRQNNTAGVKAPTRGGVGNHPRLLQDHPGNVTPTHENNTMNWRNNGPSRGGVAGDPRIQLQDHPSNVGSSAHENYTTMGQILGPDESAP